MSDNYCSAGKIECSNYNDGLCIRGGGYYTDKWEQCPWPSKQKPLEDKRIQPLNGYYTMPGVDKSNHINSICEKINEVIGHVNRLLIQ